MLNHKRPKQTTWTYTDEKKGFIIEAVDEIKRGEQVYDSYGKKCNSRFFLNYGFIVDNNDANEIPLKIYYSANDQFKKMKQDMIADTSEFKKFRVQESLNENIMLEFFSWLRFVEYDENITLLYQYKAEAQNSTANNRGSDSEDDDPTKGFKAKNLPPLSMRNEKKVLLRAKLECIKKMGDYPTTLE